jgi:hypothetical protein
MPDNYEVVSIKEFARRAGVSDTAIKKYYLDTLKIPLEARTTTPNGSPRLFYELAKSAYQIYNVTVVFDETSRIALGYPATENPEQPEPEKVDGRKNPKPRILTAPKPSKQKTGSVSHSERIRFSKSTKAATPDLETEEDETDQPEPDTKKQKVRDMPAKEPTEMDVGKLEILESERRTKSANARIAEMNMLEKQGKLVDKQKQEKTLFQFGIQIRDKIMSIPQRIIDQIRAADTRNEAELILTVELNKALKELAEFKES